MTSQNIGKSLLTSLICAVVPQVAVSCSTKGKEPYPGAFQGSLLAFVSQRRHINILGLVLFDGQQQPAYLRIPKCKTEKMIIIHSTEQAPISARMHTVIYSKAICSSGHFPVPA